MTFLQSLNSFIRALIVTGFTWAVIALDASLVFVVKKQTENCNR